MAAAYPHTNPPLRTSLMEPSCASRAELTTVDAAPLLQIQCRRQQGAVQLRSMAVVAEEIKQVGTFRTGRSKLEKYKLCSIASFVNNQDPLSSRQRMDSLSPTAILGSRNACSQQLQARGVRGGG